jgi:DNA polymerase III alpha subunit
MNVEERLVADYGGTGLTIGKHPMHYERQALCRQGVLTASELQKRRNGEYVKTAGLAIVKQRRYSERRRIHVCGGWDWHLQHHREQGLLREE